MSSVLNILKFKLDTVVFLPKELFCIPYKMCYATQIVCYLKFVGWGKGTGDAIGN